MPGEKKNSCFVRTLTPEQTATLREKLTEHGWTFSEAPYCHFKAQKEKTSLAAYQSGKLVVQGRGSEDFIQFLLEPEVLHEFGYGFERDQAALTADDPVPEEPFEAHAGIDESGKGDFFGPLVVCCVFVDSAEMAKKLKDAGVRDSKEIKNDNTIQEIARRIARIVHGKFAYVVMTPDAYNRLYTSFHNLNRLLAWGHARSLENLLEKAPECKQALADKFGDERLIQNALMKAGRNIQLNQRTKAESDIAVGAASIMARAEFVRRMKKIGEEVGYTLPKGASAQVDKIAQELAAKGGAELLGKVAKMHFRTAYRALGLPEPERPAGGTFHHR